MTNTSTSLVLVGSGIKFIAHLTHEAKAYIQQADIVLYLVNDPAMKKWLQKANAHTESLDPLYMRYPLRIDCYRAITSYILEILRKNQHVCVVLYGHPSVFSKPGLDAVIQAKREGFYAKILPGISAEACLFADLLIDPGTYGCQSFETTDLLIHRRQVDNHCHLILWQVDIIGVLENPEIHDNRLGAKILLDYLKQYYNLDHEVVLYEAAQYPGFEPRIDRLILEQLPDATFSRLSTLYIPPAHKAHCDTAVLKTLNINIDQLK